MKNLINKTDQLQLFSFLWAVASLFHIASFITRLYLNPFAWLTVITALAVLLRPKNVILFMAMLLFSICKTFIWLPGIPNHLLFEFFVNIGILSILSAKMLPAYFYKTSIMKPAREKLYNAFAPMVRVSLILLYFFAVLHKLNWDYLNPLTSCGPFLLEGLRTHGLSFIPDNTLVSQFSIYGTLIIETAIPTLFLFKSTRRWGIFLGLGFHYFLSLHPLNGLYSFSALLFSLYVLFTPKDFPRRVTTVINTILGTNSEDKRLTYKMLIFGALSFLTIMSVVKSDHPIKYVILCGWSIYAIFLIVTYLIIFFKYDMKEESFSTTFNTKEGNAWIIPALLFINGLSPYLGFKTETSFSMFSNLRTEGGITNHLLIPASFHLTNWEEDLVSIKATNLKRLEDIVDHDQYLTFFEFKRMVSRTVNPNFFVSYARDGVDHLLEVNDGISSNQKITEKGNWLLSKFVHFRPIDKIGCSCKH